MTKPDPHAPEPNLLCDNAEGGAQQVVIDRGSAHSLTLSPDGHLLAYISRRGSHSFLAMFDVNALALTFPAPSTGNDSAPSFSPDGKQLAWLREPFTDVSEFAVNRVSANPWSIQLATLDGSDKVVGERTLFTPEAGKPGSVLPRFATGDPRVWWAGNDKLLFCSEADGWNHLYAISVQGVGPMHPTLLSPGPYEVEDVSATQGDSIISSSSNSSASRCPGR